METYFVDGVRAFREVVSTWDGFESYLPKIEHLIENICDIGKRSFVRNEPGSGYNVLNHGDFHLRNILMKLDTDASKRLENFRLVRIKFDIKLSSSINFRVLFRLISKSAIFAVPYTTWIISSPSLSRMKMDIFTKMSWLFSITKNS